MDTRIICLQYTATPTTMKIEFRTPDTQLLSREEVIRILKENPKFFEDGETPVVEILQDDVVIHRTKKLGKVQRLFAALLEDLKKIKE
jgi:hypothetical protein